MCVIVVCQSRCGLFDYEFRPYGRILEAINSYSMVACTGEGFACGALIVHYVECSFVIVCWRQLGLHTWLEVGWFVRGRFATWWGICITFSLGFHIPWGYLHDQDYKKSSFSKSSNFGYKNIHFLISLIMCVIFLYPKYLLLV